MIATIFKDDYEFERFIKVDEPVIIEFEDGKMLIFIPPKNSLEYQKLLNVFAREEDGWVEAERKRDIEKLKQKRLRFIKQAQMKRKIVQFFGGQKGR